MNDQQDHPTLEASKELGDEFDEFELNGDAPFLEALRRWLTNGDGAGDAELHEIWRELNTGDQ